MHDYFAEKPLAKPPNLMPTFPTQHDQVRHAFLRSSIPTIHRNVDLLRSGVSDQMGEWMVYISFDYNYLQALASSPIGPFDSSTHTNVLS